LFDSLLSTAWIIVTYAFATAELGGMDIKKQFWDKFETVSFNLKDRGTATNGVVYILSGVLSAKNRKTRYFGRSSSALRQRNGDQKQIADR
jgi:hypothetical protein